MNFFPVHGVACKPVPTRPHERTPDFVIELAQPVVCEVKQIDPNKEDLQELAEAATVGKLGPGERHTAGRMMPNRIRPILKRVSAQLRRASADGTPTVLAIYDATPFQSYTHDNDVVQGMFGHLSVAVWEDESGEIQHSDTFFGTN